MDDRFKRFPAYLAERTRIVRLGPDNSVPTLLAHPDWRTPAPTVIWLHGRTVNKELDPGRYLRWIRAGIAACAIDLPGHGERADAAMQEPARTLDVLDQVQREIDQVIESLADPHYGGLFDLDRLAIGGMSAGGMATLRRLCEPHPFVCATVEATTGNLAGLYAGAPGRPWPVSHPPERVAALDPMQHLAGFRPIALLALHTEADAVVPIDVQRTFLARLRAHYAAQGADPDMIEFRTWPETGAPLEHNGFGRHANDAKNTQLEFLRRHLRPSAPAA